MRIIHTPVFATESGGGNSSPVVLDGVGLSDESMLDLTRRFGRDTVFVLAPEQHGDVCVRYFVPDHEMGVSGHATIAGVTVGLRGKTLPAGEMRVETLKGVFDVTTAPGAPSLLHVIVENSGDAVLRTAFYGSAQLISDETV